MFSLIIKGEFLLFSKILEPAHGSEKRFVPPLLKDIIPGGPQKTEQSIF